MRTDETRKWHTRRRWNFEGNGDPHDRGFSQNQTDRNQQKKKLTRKDPDTWTLPHLFQLTQEYKKLEDEFDCAKLYRNRIWSKTLQFSPIWYPPFVSPSKPSFGYCAHSGASSPWESRPVLTPSQRTLSVILGSILMVITCRLIRTNPQHYPHTTGSFTSSPWCYVLLDTVRTGPLRWLMWFTYYRCLRNQLKCHFLKIELNNRFLHMLHQSINERRTRWLGPRWHRVRAAPVLGKLNWRISWNHPLRVCQTGTLLKLHGAHLLSE